MFDFSEASRYVFCVDTSRQDAVETRHMMLRTKLNMVDIWTKYVEARLITSW